VDGKVELSDGKPRIVLKDAGYLTLVGPN